ncbi:MAG: dTMP kinase [Thermoplasmata archaeon]|jgi:dTMP kinase|nr:dTMP kinase [Thermoplasmata archaeon]
MRGKFITFEGIDGSGKTTIASLLHKKLGSRSVLTFEPTDSWIGRSVGKAIEEGRDAITIALLFMADRREHIKEIEKWLSEGKIVICDRFMDSTFAYQSEHMNMENAEKWLRTVHSPFMLIPDLTFLLRISPEKAMERIKGRRHEAYEYEDFLRRVQENYLRIASMEKERIVVIDAERSKEEIMERCLEILTKRNLI